MNVRRDRLSGFPEMKVFSGYFDMIMMFFYEMNVLRQPYLTVCVYQITNPKISVNYC